MEETNGKDNLHINVMRHSSLRTVGSFKTTTSGGSTPKGSPSFRRLRTSRKDFKRTLGRLPWFPGNRLVFLLVLITVWVYIGFYIQSNWAHDEYLKTGLVGYDSKFGDVHKVMVVSGTVDTLVDKLSNPSKLDSVALKEGHIAGNFSVNLVTKRRSGFSQQNTISRSYVPEKVLSEYNGDANADGARSRRNISYGLLVGPFDNVEDSVLGWKADGRKIICDKKGEFGQFVMSRKFVLIFHELSMTGAPLSMMELATEILSCGGSVRAVVLNTRGGLMKELKRRGIKVLRDKGKLSYRVARRADLIIAGSAVCSTWIEQYVSRSSAGSSQILWWIMENRREYFDRSKNLLNQVKMVMFISDLQSIQWLNWCKEEHIQLKTKPTIVPLSLNDELAFVAGISCSFNTPSFTVEMMQEKRKVLRSVVRKELGLTDSDMLVISLSSINPAKGQFLLLESVLSLVKQKPSLIGVSNSFQDGNFSNVSMQDESQQGTFSGRETHKNLEDILLQTDSKVNSTLKRRKKCSTLPKLFSMNNSSEVIQHLDSSGQRNLMFLESNGVTESKLKVLIGSVGSKSNKFLYVKRILNYLSRHPELSKSLLWTPATTFVSSLYTAADVYVINAQGLGETFGRVTVEAMAFGLPVLGTDAGGTKEIVDNKVTGLLHPIGQQGIQPLAQNLQFLLSNLAARQQLGKNGRLKVEKMFLKRHMYKKLAEVFIKCMKTQ